MVVSDDTGGLGRNGAHVRVVGRRRPKLSDRPKRNPSSLRGRRPITTGMARFDFEELVERLPLVVYVDKLDDKSSPLYISPQIAKLMGYSQEEWLADPDLFTNSLHPDDRERVLADLVDRNAGLTGSTTMFLDYRLIARDGRVVWIRDDEIVVPDADGRPIAAQGYMQDVTDRRQDSLRLELLVGILSLAADETPPDEIVAAAAERLAALFGDVEVSYVERRNEGGFWIRYTTHRASRSSGTGRVERRVRRAPQRGAAHHRGRHEGSLARPDPRAAARAQRRLVRGRAAPPQRQAARRSLVQQRSASQVGRARSLAARRRRRPARDRPRERRGSRAAARVPSATCVTATRSSRRSAARPSAFSPSRTSTRRSSS